MKETRNQRVHTLCFTYKKFKNRQNEAVVIEVEMVLTFALQKGIATNMHSPKAVNDSPCILITRVF